MNGDEKLLCLSIHHSYAGFPIVWVLWVLKHPCFSKLWVQAPTLFRRIFPLDPSKWKNGVRNSTCTQKKIISSTHTFKILTGAWYVLSNEEAVV